MLLSTAGLSPPPEVPLCGLRPARSASTRVNASGGPMPFACIRGKRRGCRGQGEPYSPSGFAAVCGSLVASPSPAGWPRSCSRVGMGTCCAHERERGASLLRRRPARRRPWRYAPSRPAPSAVDLGSHTNGPVFKVYISSVGREVIDESRKCPMCGHTTWIPPRRCRSLSVLEGGLKARAYSCDRCGFIRWQRMDKTESPS